MTEKGARITPQKPFGMCTKFEDLFTGCFTSDLILDKKSQQKPNIADYNSEIEINRDKIFSVSLKSIFF